MNQLNFYKLENIFINIFNSCYTKEENDIKTYYYDKDYILKEKLYRLSGNNKPEKNYNENDIIFYHYLKENRFLIGFNSDVWVLDNFNVSYTNDESKDIILKILQRLINDDISVSFDYYTSTFTFGGLIPTKDTIIQNNKLNKLNFKTYIDYE